MELLAGRGIHILQQNVSFDNCDFHGITAELGMFRITSSDKFALLNSTVRDSSGDLFISSSCSSGVYIGGCEVSNNKFRDMFASELVPITVEGCTLGDNDIIDWYADMEKLGSLYENSKAVDPREMSILTANSRKCRKRITPSGTLMHQK